MHGMSDTAPDVERRMFAALGAMSPARKLKLVTDAYTVARQLHAAGHVLRYPQDGAQAISRAWADATLGPGPWMERIASPGRHQPAEHDRPLTHVIAVMDAMNIRYAIGGSLASSIHGRARFTQDADLVVEPFALKAKLVALRFPPAEYYADETMIREAIAHRSNFNILHLETMFKIDCFVQKDRAFDAEMLNCSLRPRFSEQRRGNTAFSVPRARC